MHLETILNSDYQSRFLPIIGQFPIDETLQCSAKAYPSFVDHDALEYFMYSVRIGPGTPFSFVQSFP